MSAHGIEVRKGDYSDYSSLVQAFAGVEKVLLISTHAFADRKTEHANVIKAASEAGAKHVLYTPGIRPEASKFELMQVTEPDIFTVKTLKESGLTYTVVGETTNLFYLNSTGGLVIGGPDGDAGLTSEVSTPETLMKR